MTTDPTSRTFDRLPDVKDMPRDLNFKPTVNSNPKVLTQEQIAQWNRDGCLKGISVLAEHEIEDFRKYIDGLLARVLAESGDSYAISGAHLRYGRIYDMITDKRIVSIVRDLLGENVVAWGSHAFIKLPHDGKVVAWHQDASYWPMTPSKTVTVWLAIDNSHVGNGCMRFMAGSHHQGHLTFRPSRPEEHNVLNQTIDNAHQYGHEVLDELKPGEISLHSDLLLHSSEKNESDQRRAGLALRYCSVEVRALMNWHEKGVIVSGVDPANFWANPRRPVTD